MGRQGLCLTGAAGAFTTACHLRRVREMIIPPAGPRSRLGLTSLAGNASHLRLSKAHYTRRTTPSSAHAHSHSAPDPVGVAGSQPSSLAKEA